MALVINDRVRETTQVVGTGSATLLGAVSGYQDFSVIGNGNTTYYCIADQGGPNWEVGIGTWSSGGTLDRTTVLASSNSGSLVNFIAGTKDVFVTQPSETAVYSSNAPGTSGYVLTSAGSGAASVWTDPSSIVTGAAGSNTQVQYNNSGALGASANFTFDGTTLTTTGNAIISDNSSNDALRITQTGSGNALLVEDSANPDSSPFVINTSGKVIVGATTTYNPYSGRTTSVEINSVSSTLEDGLALTKWANTTSGNYLITSRSRGSIGVQTTLANADTIGGLVFQGSDGTGFVRAAEIVAQVDGTPATGSMPGRLVFSTTADGASSPTERMRIRSDGNVGIGDSGAVSQTLRISKAVTGNANSSNITISSTVQSDVTSLATGVYSFLSTAASAFTLSTLTHFRADQNTIGAGSTVTNQYGFFANSTLTGATNNYGFYGNIASGTGRYNFYAAGAADNYFAGGLGIGSTAISSSGRSLAVGKNITGATAAIGVFSSGTTMSDVTSQSRGFATSLATTAASFTLGKLSHYQANQGTIGAGSTVTTQIGFEVVNSLTGATNNYGFYSDIASGTGRYNLYMAGTADNYFAGNVGIGVTAPGFPLEVQSNASAYGIAIRGRSADNISVLRFVSNDGATNYGQFDVRSTGFIINAVASVPLQFNTANTERMRIDSSGNVGIGTSSPATKLDVAGNIRFSAANPVIELNNGGPQVYSTSANTLQFATGGGIGSATERMRIDSSGNVGIGTTSPTAKFEVSTNTNTEARITSTINVPGQTNTLRFSSLASGGAYAGGGAYVQSIQGAGIDLYSLAFGTAGYSSTATERMRIDSSGRLVVGATTPAVNSKISCYSAPFSYMCTTSGVDGQYERMLTYGYVGDLAGSNTNRENYFDSSVTAGAAVSNQIRIKCYNGGASGTPTLAAYFTGAGTVFNAANSASWNTTSDKRIKENIVDLSNGLNVINSLRPVTYDYTKEFSDYMDWTDNKRLNHDGFIAQEYATVLPTKVRTDDFNSNGLNISNLMSINQGDLIPYLVKAIQELNAKVESLEAQLKGN